MVSGTAGRCKFKGTFTLTNCVATVVHISNTQLDTVKLQMVNEDKDCYLHVRRNLNCKQLDLSGSTGKVRQLAGYRNAFSDENSLLCTDCRRPNSSIGCSISKTTTTHSLLCPYIPALESIGKRIQIAMGSCRRISYRIHECRR